VGRAPSNRRRSRTADFSPLMLEVHQLSCLQYLCPMRFISISMKLPPTPLNSTIWLLPSEWCNSAGRCEVDSWRVERLNSIGKRNKREIKKAYIYREANLGTDERNVDIN